MTKRRYEAVEAPTNTEEAKQAAIDYWLARHREAAQAIGITSTRLAQLGVPIPLTEAPERLDLL